MIEYGKLTDLEDDFITVWSDYILYQDKSRVWHQITKLAELGQVNAISCWYMLKNKEDKNPVIEEFVQPLLHDLSERHNYSEYVLLSHYYLSKEGGWTRLNSCAENMSFYKNRMNKSDTEKQYESWHNLCKSAEKELLDLGFMDNGLKAMHVLSQMIGFEYDPLMKERYLEISLGALNPYALNIKKKSVKKQLLKMYKSTPQNTQVKYSFAKNLVFFSDNAKQVNLGRKLLTELADRELKTEATHKNQSKSSENVFGMGGGV